MEKRDPFPLRRNRLTLSRLFSIKDKVVVVTGASQGVGKAAALTFVALGAKVTAVSRSMANSAILQNPKAGKNFLPLGIDVTQKDQVQTMIDETVKRYGRVDVLVNNAGIFLPSEPEEITEENWDRVINTNLKGAFLCAQAAGRVMIAQRRGKIINVSSVSGSRATPIPLSASYDASKGGLDNLTKALAVAWAKHHINVNAIAPCALETPMKFPLSESEESRKMAWIPMNRRAAPDDLMGAIVFLSSPASDFMTGHVLAVDGGRLAW